MNSIQPAIPELERLYRELKRLFPGGNPVIVIQTASRSSSSLGQWTPQAWEDGRHHEINEIAISAERLACPLEKIAAALLHEMVHHFNALRGVRDGSGPRGYHNRAFREVALAIGLTAARDGRCGWASTQLGPRARLPFPRFKPRKGAFNLFRKASGGARAPTKLHRWSCG